MNLTKEVFEYFATSLWDKTNEKFVVQEEGKTLTSNDYTDEDKNKLNKVDVLVGDADLETESKIVTGAINELKEQIRKSGNSDYGTITKEDLGLENVDNTSDINKPVSTAQQEAIDNAITESKGYTDTKVANLIGSAPETLNTLEEVAQAIEENEGVVEALNSAIGNKANQNDLEALQDVVDTKIGQDDLTGFMTSENPTGTGSLSMNRKADTVIGQYSTTLGYDNTASGIYSHAEGGSSKAEAKYAHAEGNATFATGEASHSEGYNSTASGINSHAEGTKTKASKDNAHAEGGYTTASGNQSHAEGDTTFATGTNSHAEGNVSRANGLNSHAEGYYTTANGENQHVQGKFNAIDNNNTYAHIVGGGTSDAYADRKNIHTLDWNGNAEFAGDVTATDSEGNKVSLVDLASASGEVSGDYLTTENPTGTGSFSMNRKADTTVGNYSTTLGYNTTASGQYSHAEGQNTVASGTASHSEGWSATASGQYSHAEGAGAKAVGAFSHAEGEGSEAEGRSSHAEGWQSEAIGDYSHAEGNHTIASGENQHVQGKYNIEDENNTYAHIVGNGNIDENYEITCSNAHTLDWDGNAWFAGDVTATDSEGNSISLVELANSNSGSEDYLTTENPVGIGSLSMNRKEGSIVGEFSTTLGNNTTASGDYSHAEGCDTQAVGDYSHAEGSSVSNSITIIGDANATTYTVSSWNNYLDVGKVVSYTNNNTTIYANITAIDEAILTFTVDKTLSSTALDNVSMTIYNGGIASGDYSHSEGNVTTASGSGSHAEGNGTIASGQSSHAEGFNAIASGYGSHAEGYGSEASGSGSHAEGHAIASGSHSHAEGAGTASGDYSHAEGIYTIASGDYSHAEGSYTTASGDYQHVQGKYNIEDANSTYAHIVGNGNWNESSNAHTLDWDGNAWFAGDVTATNSSGTLVSLINHTHDGRYYTESEIDTKLNAKANSSHGNHVPTKETANNARFLRNDNTWQTITPANIGASAAHSHPYLPTAGGTVTGTLTASGGILISGASKLTNLLNLGDTLAPDKSRYYINGNATGRFNALRYVTTSKLSSARRYKENIEYTDIDYWHDRLMKVKPCTFNFINDKDKKFNVGVIAEDLEEYLPEFVDYNENGECESVYYTEFIIPMLSEIQRLNSIIDTQQATINNLLEKFDELEQKIK